MSRPSKLQIEQRKNREANSEKAQTAILEAFAKLLKKHLPNMLRSGVATEGNLAIKIDEGGKAAIRLTYSTVMSEGASFELDDGQEDLGPEPGKEPGGDAPGESKT